MDNILQTLYPPETQRLMVKGSFEGKNRGMSSGLAWLHSMRGWDLLYSILYPGRIWEGQFLQRIHNRESNIFPSRQSSGGGGYYRKVEGLRERFTLDTETHAPFPLSPPRAQGVSFPTWTEEGRNPLQKTDPLQRKGSQEWAFKISLSRWQFGGYHPLKFPLLQ